MPTAWAYVNTGNNLNLVIPSSIDRNNSIGLVAPGDLFFRSGYTSSFIANGQGPSVFFNSQKGQLYIDENQKINNYNINNERGINYMSDYGALAPGISVCGDVYEKQAHIVEITSGIGKPIKTLGDIIWCRPIPSLSIVAVKCGDTIQIIDKENNEIAKLNARKQWILRANYEPFKQFYMGNAEIDYLDNGLVAYCESENCIVVYDTKTKSEYSRVKHGKIITAFKLVSSECMLIAEEGNLIFVKGIEHK